MPLETWEYAVKENGNTFSMSQLHHSSHSCWSQLEVFFLHPTHAVTNYVDSFSQSINTLVAYFKLLESQPDSK